MCFTADSYSAIILYEFPAFFTCTCDVRNLVRGVEGIQGRVSGVIVLFIAVLPPSSFVFVVQIGKKSMVSVHLFLRLDMSCRRKKLIEGGGGGKGSCCEWPNSYKENESTRNIGIYI